MKAKTLCASLALVGLVLLGGSAFAELNTIDQVPAATLLLPYFEVDVAGTSGVTTFFSINNASAAPALAHVTVWSNLSIPLIDFNVFLTGYDVQVINMQDIIVDGLIPITADEQNDTATDSISPSFGNTGPLPAFGGLPTWDNSFAGCAGQLGAALPNPLPGTLIELVTNGTTGNPVAFFNNLCASASTGGTTATGYVTVDNVNQCNTAFPNDAAYHTNIVSTVNQLWGDYQILDPANAFAFGDTLVHIEADPTGGSANAGMGYEDPDYTFYRRYVTGTTAAGDDEREGLTSQWAVRYVNGGAFSGGTSLLVWRDSRVALGTADVFACAAGPPLPPYPLNERWVVAFNEQEEWTYLCQGGQLPVSPPLPGDPPCFPYETQRTVVGVGELAPPYNFGWLYLDLDIPGTNGGPAQSWVTSNMSALGLYTVGANGIQLDNVTQAGFFAVP